MTQPPANTPIPSCLYSCSSDSCAEERSWPADNLHWVPAWDGWYCGFCIEDRTTEEDQDVEVGPTLAAWMRWRRHNRKQQHGG